MHMVKDVYLKHALRMVENARVSEEVTGDKVYQPANHKNRMILDEIMEDLLLPGSRFENIQALVDLYQKAQEGKSCLILMDHYSNFDSPAFHYLIRKALESTTPIPGAGRVDGLTLADSIIFIAGIKLNTDSPFVRAFTESLCRLVIYPSRSLNALEGKPEYEAEKKRSRNINMASLAQMVRKKHEGHLILLFPSGTRYRPGIEETRRGLPEVDSYLRAFDYALPIAIGGNILRVNPEGTMADDFVTPDVMIFQPGDVIEAGSLREQVRQNLAPGVDPKQATSDRVMEMLMDLHKVAKAKRLPLLSPDHPADDDGVEV